MQPSLQPTRRSANWAGDAVCVLQTLAPDDAALTAALQMLGLQDTLADAARRAASDDTPPPAPRPDPGANGDLRRDATAAMPSPKPDAADGPDHRLPSLLERGSTIGTATARPRPDWVDQTPAMHIDADRPPADPSPLFSRLQRRAMLSLALGRDVPEGAPDGPAIVRTLSRAMPLLRIPRRPRRTLRYGAEVWIDRADWLQPYHPDQDALVRYLRQLLPGDRLTLRWINGGPPDAHPVPAAHGTARNAAERASPVPTDAAVLLLSDLGAGYRASGPPPASADTWLHWLRSVQRLRGRPCVALLPVHPSRWLPRRGVAALHWSEKTTLRDVLRLRQGTAWSTASIAEAPASPGTSEHDITELATLASAALRIDTALLRELRLRFAKHLDVGVEADLWFSPLVQSRGHAGIVLRPEAAQRLRGALARHADVQAVLGVVQRHETGRSASIRLEQALYRLELRESVSEADIEPLLREALKAVSQPGAEGRKVAVWAAHAWGRMAPALRRSNAARQLAFAAAARMGSVEWLTQDGAGPPVMPSDTEWLLPAASFPRVAVSVELRRYGDGTLNVVVGPAQTPTAALHLIELPQTEPMWLQVEVEAGAVADTDADGRPSASHSQLVQLDASGAAQVHIPAASNGSAVTLQALTGPRHRLRLADPASWLERTVLGLDRRRSKLGMGGVSFMPAVVVDARLAVVPFGLGSQPVVESEFDLTAMPTRLWLRNPVGEADIRARLVGELDLGYGDRAVVIKLVDDPVWTPLDPSVQCLAPTGASDTRQLLIRMSDSGALDARPATRQPDGTYSIDPGTVPGRFSTAVVAPVSEPGWSFILRNRRIWKDPADDDPTLVQPVGYSYEEVRQQARWLAAERWCALLLTAPESQHHAEVLYRDLLQRMGHERVRFGPELTREAQADAGWSGPLKEALADCDAVVLVGAAPASLWLSTLLHRAIVAGLPLLWAPFHPSPQSVLQDWPNDVAAAVRNRQWLGFRADGRSEEPAEVAEQIARWRPDGARPPEIETQPAENAEPVADEPPADTSFGTSLRAKFAALIERRDGESLGLFRCDLGRALKLSPAGSLPTGATYLLLLHGEAANAEASFAGLRDSAAAEDRARLHQRYGERCLAFEYRSVTVGPVANALALAQALPQAAVLHIVSVSAGGLIGELLCRGERSDGAAPMRPPTSPPSPDQESGFRKNLESLSAELTSKGFRIERFVRIACPAQGVNLFSKGVGRAVTAVETALLLTPWLSRLPRTLGADRLFTDPQATPGLTALQADSALLRLLNEPVVTRSALTVLAGHTEKSGFFGWLSQNAAQWLSGDTRTDLVVPVASAFGGMEREGGVDYLVIEGSDIDHFKYFSHPQARRAIVDALLTTSGTPPGLVHAARLADVPERFANDTNKAPPA